MLYKGIECLVLENGRMRACILPQIGSHVCSLYDKLEGRELLLQGREERYILPEDARDFDSGECAGIDDMFPAAAATIYQGEPFDGRELPDHGDVWRSAFSVLGCTQTEAVMAAEGTCMPYRLEKRFVLDGNCLRVEYTLTNLSDLDYKYIWAAHPMFAGCADFRLLLPSSVDRVTIGWGEGTQYTPEKEYEWPVLTWDDGTEQDVSAAPGPQAGYCYKLVTARPLEQGWCGLVDGKRKYGIEVRFDAAQTPFLGVWMDGNGLKSRPQFDVAIEPSTTRSVYVERQDGMDQGYLKAGQEKRWWISYRAGRFISYDENVCCIEFE